MHDALNAVYDAASRTLEGAQDLRGEMRRPGAEAALAPLLGCIEAVLDELVHAQEDVHARLAAPKSFETHEERCVRLALADLAEKLTEAQRACGSARAVAARSRPWRAMAEWVRQGHGA